MVWKKKNPPMFIKLRAKRFWGRLTVQERGEGLGDIFTQNTLSAIKAVCQVLGLSLCGRGGGAGVRQRGGGEGPFPMETTTPTRVQQLGGPQQLTHICMQTHTQRFLLSCIHCSVNTAHIITLRRWPLTPVSLPSWFPHVQVSAVTHGHTDQGHSEGGGNTTHMKTNSNAFIQLTHTYSHLIHLINTSCTKRGRGLKR